MMDQHDLELLLDRLRGVTADLERLAEEAQDTEPSDSVSRLVLTAEKIRRLSTELDGATDRVEVDVPELLERITELEAMQGIADAVADMVESQDVGREVPSSEVYALRLLLRDAGYFKVRAA